MRFPSVALLAVLVACRSPFGAIERSNAVLHLDQAEAELAAGETERALFHLEAIQAVEGLEPDQRQREQRLIDEAARRRFAELADAPEGELKALFDSDLPERVRSRAGILAAQRLLEEDQRIRAYRLVRQVDTALPGHSERVLAGDVLARAGLSLIRDRRRYRWIFRYRPRGVQALEYLVVNYPLEPRCDEATFELSQAYEESGDLDQAIARTEDLLLYYPDSRYASAALARLPYLRLCRLQRDDYDRGELQRARAEIEGWLGTYPEHELGDWVTGLAHECDRRLVRSDLYLARYYRRTRTPRGQRLHAERAQTLAVTAGLTTEAAEAAALLAEVPEPGAP